MKKGVMILIMSAVMVFGGAVSASAISVQVDGRTIECDVEPVNIDSRVLVPVRAIFEALGAEVDWDDETKTVFASRGGEYIKLVINSSLIETGVFNSGGYEVRSCDVEIDVPAKIIDSRTFVPVRAVSETLRANVDWDNDTKTVFIDNPPSDNKWIYYSSEHDYGNLYAVTADGMQRRRLSDKSVKDIKYYNGLVYYISRDDNMLYRNDGTTEQLVAELPVYIAGFKDNYVYYMESGVGMPEKTGVLCRSALDTLTREQLTTSAVRYAEVHGDYVFYNELNDDRMYSKNLTSLEVNTLTMGDNLTLYPFNCYFSDDFVFVENAAWYNTITRLTPDGLHRSELNDCYSTICSNQLRNSGKIVYINSDEGQDIYVMNIDGSDNHKIADLDSNWFSVSVLSQWGNTVYYKNAFRDEVYSADLNGTSYGNYVAYAKDVKVKNGKLFAVYDGLYAGEPNGDLTQIFYTEVSDYKNYGGYAYVTEKESGYLYKVGYDASQKKIINEYITEWDCNFAE